MYDREEFFIHPGETLNDKMARREAFRDAYLKAYPDRYVAPESANVIWVLGFGKSGTTTLSKILNLSEDIVAYHEPSPRLWMFDREAYHKCGYEFDRVILGARNDYVQVINAHNKIYCEVNHRTTFLAPSVKRVYPKAKFIFIWRDMDEVIESAYSWGLYSETDQHLQHRITSHYKTRREKIADNWIKTNTYALDFLDTLSDSDKFMVSHNDIKNGHTQKFIDLFAHMNVIEPSHNEINALLSVKFNESQHKERIVKNWGHIDPSNIYERIG